MVLAPDNLPAHLPSYSSTTLLLHITLPFSDHSIPTLVDSSTTDNFIDKSLLHSTNPHIDWPTFTLHLDWDNPTNSGLVLFNVLPPSENPKTTINQLQTLPQLCSRSVLPALVDSGTSSTFVSSQLDLCCNDLNKPLELQLFDESPTSTGITQYHDNTITLDHELQFQAQFLVTPLPLSTPIILGLPWLQDINSDIDWKNLTMQFSSPKASLAATIPLCLQSILDPNIPNFSGQHLWSNPKPLNLQWQPRR
ncbi:hypothetical protein E4T56_gene18412 [Termitomyces sp. T112]|nr:hypothetical protein E4T56_gene18412 [Termitomyces sp. T112]